MLQRLCSRQTLHRVNLKNALHEVFSLGRDLAPELVGILNGAFAVVCQDLLLTNAFEAWLTAEHQVQDGSRAEDVGICVIALRGQQLWRRVAG